MTALRIVRNPHPRPTDLGLVALASTSIAAFVIAAMVGLPELAATPLVVGGLLIVGAFLAIPVLNQLDESPLRTAGLIALGGAITVAAVVILWSLRNQDPLWIGGFALAFALAGIVLFHRSQQSRPRDLITSILLPVAAGAAITLLGTFSTAAGVVVAALGVAFAVYLVYCTITGRPFPRPWQRHRP